MQKNKYIKLAISIVLPLLAGAIGSLFTSSKIPTWYAGLEKASLNPPSWVFGPVWTTLYILMGVALYLVWSKNANSKQAKIAMRVFFFQLVLNSLWSIAFFGWENPLIALVVIALLWISILINIILFYKISKPAAWLLVPYILWVSFASYLNYSIWALN